MSQPSPERQGALELRQDAGGLRYYLAGKGVHAGDVLEMLFPGNVWVRGRYESSRNDVRPLFYIALGGDWEKQAEAEPLQVAFSIPDEATLRWPVR